MADKWYDRPVFNHIGKGIGIGLVIVSIGLGAKSCQRTSYNDITLEQIKQGYQLISSDLNGNNIPEEFYQIGNQKAFVSIDGKSLESKLFGK
jgi:hypothetical protein